MGYVDLGKDGPLVTRSPHKPAFFESIVRKTPAPKAGACQEAAPTEAKSGSKIAAVLEKAKTGITMDEVRAMTGWAKTGGFFGACKRRGLTLTKRKDGNVTVYIAA